MRSIRDILGRLSSRTRGKENHTTRLRLFFYQLEAGKGFGHDDRKSDTSDHSSLIDLIDDDIKER